VRRLLLLLTVALLLVTTACGGGSDDKLGEDDTGSISGMHVSGSFGSAPSVRFDKPVKVKGVHSDVIEKGDGDAIKPGGKALLNMYIANGKTGKKAVSTYDQGQPLNATMDESQFFPPLVKVLNGKPSGTRVAFADTVKDLYGAAGAKQLGLKTSDSLVFIIDVMSVTPTDVLDGPHGTDVSPPKDVPGIVTKNGTIQGLDFAKAPKKPGKKLRVVQLVKGTGDPIKGAKIVKLNYVGQVYGRNKPFENSYRKPEPATFVVGDPQLIKGWNKALPGQRVGSRLMLIVPPAEGYGKRGAPDIGVTGKSTLVFVMDVLGVG
jgi:FKBP-type peptidyl-prolyl cis-trans isomerase